MISNYLGFLSHMFIILFFGIICVTNFVWYAPLFILISTFYMCYFWNKIK